MNAIESLFAKAKPYLHGNRLNVEILFGKDDCIHIIAPSGVVSSPIPADMSLAEDWDEISDEIRDTINAAALSQGLELSYTPTHHIYSN